MSPRRIVFFSSFITTCGLIFFVLRDSVDDGRNLRAVLQNIHPSFETPTKLGATSCTQSIGWLEQYGFTSPIQYVSRDIIARPREDAERLSLTLMKTPLFETFTEVNLADSQTIQIEKCLPPLELEVPHAAVRVDASNMIFGLQTTIMRLRDTVKHLNRWLPNTGARLFAIVIDVDDDQEVPADDKQMKALEKEFHELSMNVSVIHPVRPTDSFAQRYFSLANVMYAARDEKTQWIVHIDDDTLFPSLYDLQRMLELHDWRKPQYIGSLSEDWWAVNHYGLMAFGGAGVFISIPLAQIIDDHTDECKENLRTSAGDITVMDCVYRFSSVKLTHVAGLHQVDLHGDLSGLYESGREMLSLHHWKGDNKLEIEKMHMVADICDSCFLQRWQFPNDLVLSNGFSIASYPQGHLSGRRTGVLGRTMEKLDLGQIETTWDNPDMNVLHSLAPTRDKLTEEEKIGYKLFDSMIINGADIGAPGEKVVRQIYLKEGTDGARDTVMVLNWRIAPAMSTEGIPHHP
jgi:hypothetical protein